MAPRAPQEDHQQPTPRLGWLLVELSHCKEAENFMPANARAEHVLSGLHAQIHAPKVAAAAAQTPIKDLCCAAARAQATVCSASVTTFT